MSTWNVHNQISSKSYGVVESPTCKVSYQESDMIFLTLGLISIMDIGDNDFPLCLVVSCYN